MPGFGAAEGDMRRAFRKTDYSNYHRRTAHARSLINENRDALRRWAAGEDVEPVAVDPESMGQKRTEDIFRIAVDSFLRPSYALLLQAYWAYLTDPIPIRALRSVARVAEETYGRGSREMLLAILLITGTETGRKLALNIMKLHSEWGLDETLNRIWNTSFDLTYTRLAVAMPLHGSLPEPVVFATADKHLGKLLETISPNGGWRGANGLPMPEDAVDFDGLVQDELFYRVDDILSATRRATAANTMSPEQIATIRRVNAVKHIERLEANFAKRYAA